MIAKNRQGHWVITSLLVSALVALPIVFIVLAMFGPSDSAWQHIRDTLLLEYLSNTLVLMLLVAIGTGTIGITTAWLTAATEFPGRRLLSWALVLPLAAPAYIVAYVYTDLLEFSGPVQQWFRLITGLQASEYSFPEIRIRSLPGAAIIISLVLYPYVYMILRVAFVQRSATLFDAARTLGATPAKAFWRIAMPAARPALIGGLALVMMETLADFGVVDYFAVPTFSTGIFRTWFALGNMAAAMKLTAVMFILVLTLVALEKYSRRNAGTQAFSRDSNSMRLKLDGATAWIATLLCFLPVLLGGLIPFAVLIKLAISHGDPLIGDGFMRFILNSIHVASLATIITTAAALLLTYAQNIANNRLVNGSIQVATLGYAIPGAMLAIGLFAPVSQFDRWLTGAFQAHLGWQGGLILTGGVSILVYAYVVRFLTVAYNTTSSGLAQIPAVYGQAARSLGAKPGRMVRTIQLPLMMKSIAVAAILVFVDTMRELPATLLLRPFDFETLATRVYRLASDERLAEASTASLIIVLVGLFPVLFLHRFTHDDK